MTAAPATAATISLQSVIDPLSRLSETQFTGSFAEIGRNPEGLYNLANPSQQFGTADLFNETQTANGIELGIGSIDFDDAAATGVGVETFAITAFNPLFTVGADLVGQGFFLWFFDGANTSVTYGGIDANDTVTFTDGVLTGIDLTTDVTFNIDYGFIATSGPNPFGNDADGVGTFAISGSSLAIDVLDTDVVSTFFGTGPTTFIADIDGTVLAVSSAAAPVPEPTTLVMLGMGGLGAVLTVRRKRA